MAEQHSLKFKIVERWYKKGLWTADMVRDAVKAKWITQEECDQILGE